VRALREKGFSVLALCASEFQPPAALFEGIRVIYAPNEDSWEGTHVNRLKLAIRAGIEVAQALQEGKKTLVTCRMGINRSSLVTAIALYLFMGWEGAKCVQHIRQRRKGTLSNSHFSRIIRTLGTRRVAPPGFVIP
jgi:protein-tyrosine phosphatase